MNSWWLLLSLSIIFCIASLGFFLPLGNKKTRLLIAPLITLFAMSAYLHWGGFVEQSHFWKKKERERQAQQILSTLKGPEDLIARMKERLDLSPNSTRGWYLLGRLYASQDRWQEAKQAFAIAYRFHPEEDSIAIPYAQSLLQLHQPRFNKKMRSICQKVLVRNPKQPDALALLAMNAYQEGAYSNAIEYWQKMLDSLPQGSKEAQLIQKAIIKAQQQEKRTNTTKG